MKHEPQRKRRRNGAEIEALIERYRQSGLAQAEFVRGEGICLATLSRYLRKTRAATACTCISTVLRRSGIAQASGCRA